MKLISYYVWANKQILNITKSLSNDEFEKEFGGYLRSARARVLHLVGATQLWIHRLRNEFTLYSDIIASLDDLDRDHLLETWQKVDDEFIKVVNEFSGHHSVTYRTSKGVSYTNDVQDIFLHVVNHSTYHRAQLILLLRSLGREVEDTDYIFYIRKGKHVTGE